MDFQFIRRYGILIPMPNTQKRLHILNDFAFLKSLGEKGDEPQLISFLNAVLRRQDREKILSVEIIEN
ncbi:MAG: Rpn family recombination-promoting nuclease/putative transposase, partial [Spirochaetaceae bacterium]|nr:Rpn family recombination-promoting nuclease/putative transposase [Spirochaetaceae bacterium]